MRILIVGGTGLISTSITRELAAGDHELIIFNRGERAARISLDAVQVVRGDRRDHERFRTQVAELGMFDCVIDMITFTPEDAHNAIEVFADRTQQYIFTSTVDVYHKPAGRYPITEREPRRGNNEYARNKKHCEDLLLAAHEDGKFALTIIRPAWSYGEGGQIVDTLGWGTTYIDRMRKGIPIVVHGDGTSLWVGAHVDDVAHAFTTAVGNSVTYGRSYHVTGEDWVTWNQYYQLIAEVAGAPDPVMIHIPTDVLVKLSPERAALCATNFSQNNIFDNAAARADLHYRYTISLREGLRRTLQWLDEHQQIVDYKTDPLHDEILKRWTW